MSDRFVYTSPAAALAEPLVKDLIREYDSRYGEFFDREGAVVELNRYPPEAFAPPVGNFVLLVRDGAPIAGGAFKRFDDKTAEVKRMWTHSDHRRKGLASRVLAEIEAQAVRQGYARFYLTTGFRQPEAASLYLARGYEPLYDTALPHDAYRHLPFTKLIDPARHAEHFGELPRAVPVIAARAS